MNSNIRTEEKQLKSVNYKQRDLVRNEKLNKMKNNFL